MRNRFLVAYDVSDERRLRRTFRTLHGFGDPVQYSVFSCDLCPQEKVLMLAALKEVIHERQDRVLIVDLGPASRRGSECLEILGKQQAPPRREAPVV